MVALAIRHLARWLAVDSALDAIGSARRYSPGSRDNGYTKTHRESQYTENTATKYVTQFTYIQAGAREFGTKIWRDRRHPSGYFAEV